MTETRFTWRWIFVVGVLGALVGIALGLGAGWLLPVSSSNATGIAALKSDDQNQYIILVANSYALDGDLQLARDRLAELRDPNIKTRVERLAKSLTAKQDPDAPNVADLAVALGSNDTSLRVMAGNVVKRTTSEEPTKVARIQVRPTGTAQPTETPTEQPTEPPTAVPTKSAAKAQVAAPKPTNTPKPPAPAPTSAPQVAPPPPPAPAAPIGPAWTPGDRNEWWPTIQWQAASVAPGQPYWRLKSAMYCEPQDSNPDPACAEKPGGGNDYTIYVQLLDQNGNRTEGELSVQLPDGAITDEGTSAKVKSADDMCNCNYSMQISDYSIRVKGLASDSINGFCACSVHRNWGSRAHVRYFLVFQQATR